MGKSVWLYMYMYMCVYICIVKYNQRGEVIGRYRAIGRQAYRGGFD